MYLKMQEPRAGKKDGDGGCLIPSTPGLQTRNVRFLTDTCTGQTL